MRRDAALLLGALLPLILAGCEPEPPAAPDAVFLIVVDTLRPDRLSSYGYRAHETPAIDGLAARGTLFGNAYSVASWTVPSMGALLTSRYPTQLGLVEQEVEGQRFEWRQVREQSAHSLSARDRTLAEILRARGFRTAAFVNQPGLNVGKGFAQGFGDWFYPSSPQTISWRAPGDSIADHRWPPILWAAASLDSALVRKFGQWLGEHSDEKMFVWLHLLTPHYPYAPDREAALALSRNEGDLPAFYDAEIRIADGLVEDILGHVREHIDPERTLIVFTSDHGEGLGEHDMFEHGHSLHAEVVRVPLIVCAPGLTPSVVQEPVRTIDLLPTILELAGAADAIPLNAEGVSLAGRIAGEPEPSPLPVYAEAMLYGGTERSLLDDGRKLMWDVQDDGWSMYDVGTDPQELRDLAPERAEEVNELRRRIRDLHARLENERGERSDDTDREAALEALRSLGYVDR